MLENCIQTDEERKVISLHANHYPPSQIDEVMGFEPGTARAMMVDIWARDNEKAKREKAVRLSRAKFYGVEADG